MTQGRRALFGWAIVLVCWSLSGISLGAQAIQFDPLPEIKPPPPGWKPGRTPDGQPDIRGVYTGEDWIGSLDPVEGEEETYPRGNPLFGLFGRHVVDTPGGRVPFQPWADAKRKHLANTNGGVAPAKILEEIDSQTRCFPPGVPRTNWATPYNGYVFMQTPGYVIILGEWNHHYRVIPLQPRRHLSSKMKLYMGDSSGRWEGNTLVVETTNLTDETWLDWAGATNSDAMRVIERFTLVGPDTINIESTIDDPNVYTRPWTVKTVRHRAASDYEQFEYACHEGNHALDLILSK